MYQNNILFLNGYPNMFPFSQLLSLNRIKNYNIYRTIRHNQHEGLQEFDNPSRDFLQHGFLKTNIAASNQKLINNHQQPTTSESKLRSCKTVSFPQIQQPFSIYRIQSSEITYGKDQWAEVFNSDTCEANSDEEKQPVQQVRKRAPSLESKIENQQFSHKTQQTDKILRQVSGYMLSQKNLFEPIIISKEDFVRFRKDEIEKHYSFIQKIGEGSFGNVFKVYHKTSHSFRAIKILKKSAVSKSEHQKVMKEVDILKRLDHPNILKVFEVFLYRSNYYIVTEHCQGGSLSKYLKQTPNISALTIRSIFSQVMSALSYMHKLNVVHRDIKPDNILFSKKVSGSTHSEIDVRLIDFGLAKQLTVKRLKDKQKIGTYGYMSPEVIDGVYSTKCDMWSTGIVLHLMLSGKNPFKTVSKEETFQRIKKQELALTGQRWKSIDRQIKEVVIGLLSKDQKTRFSAEQVLSSRWLVSEEVNQKQKEAMDEIFSKIVGYSRGSNLTSIIQSYLAYTTSTERELQNFAKKFNFLDKNKDGFIEIKQLEKAFPVQKFSRAEMDYVLNIIEKQHSGRINYSQFVTMLSDKSRFFAKKYLVQAFQFFDQDCNGFIDRSELKQSLKDKDQLSCIFQELDQNQDQRISLEEFIQFLTKNHSHHQNSS